MTEIYGLEAPHFYRYAQDTPEGFVCGKLDGTFFCGYEQDDGSLGYMTFRQFGNDLLMQAQNVTVNSDKAVFLTADEMEERGVHAIVFPAEYDTFWLRHINKDDRKTAYFGKAPKDAVYDPGPDSLMPKSICDTGRFENNLTYGLASAAAVRDVALKEPMDWGAHIGRALNTAVATVRRKLSRHHSPELQKTNSYAEACR